MNYNELNAHPRDRRVRFDAPTHTYTVLCEDGREVACDSVTTVVEDLFEKFDAEYWAARKATADHPKEAIMAEWEAAGQRARDLGTLLHDRIERYYLGEQPDSEAAADRAFAHFLRFAASTPLRPYRSEWRIFSERYRISGTLDFLAYDGSRFVIYDWKRSAKIVDSLGHPIVDNRYGKYAGAPVAHVPDTVYQHYALQVSLYRYLLHLEYGIVVSEGFLGTFHPDYDRPYVIPMPYYLDEVKAILDARL